MKELNKCIEEIKKLGDKKIKARRKRITIALVSTFAVIALAIPVTLGLAGSAPQNAPSDISLVLDNESFEDGSTAEDNKEKPEASLPDADESSISIEPSQEPEPSPPETNDSSEAPEESEQPTPIPPDDGGEDVSKAPEEYKKPDPSWPIVFVGKYDPSNMKESASYYFITPGMVVIDTMVRTEKNINSIDDLEDGVLYPVKFHAMVYESEEFKAGLYSIREESIAARLEVRKTIIDFIAKYAEAENHSLLEYYKGYYDYYTICGFIYNQLSPEFWPGQNAPEFEEITSMTERQVWDEYHLKEMEYTKQAVASAEAVMYEQLEKQGISFYDKTLYYEHLGEIVKEEILRVAFLSKGQIAALTAGEDYGLLVEIVCDELAKKDNEPVYLPACIVLEDQCD